jgi:hypothetical protein
VRGHAVAGLWALNPTFSLWKRENSRIAEIYEKIPSKR